MVNISLTDFIDYVSKVSSTKYTLVNRIFKREDYHPAFDFWKALREGIINFHKEGLQKSDLNLILEKLTNQKKVEPYSLLIKNYNSFLGRKKIEWFDPPAKKWKMNELSIKLNPELGLEMNGKLYAIKLFFKDEKLTQNKADLIILLMNSELKNGDYKDVTFAVLDIRNKKLFNKTKLGKNHLSLLEGEALSFLNIWNSFLP